MEARDYEALRIEVDRRRRAADASLDAWLSQPRGRRDPWLLVYAQRDLAYADGIEQVVHDLLGGEGEE